MATRRPWFQAPSRWDGGILGKYKIEPSEPRHIHPLIDAGRVRSYQSLREAGKRFHGRVMEVIPKGILVSTAKELGLWKHGTFVGDEDHLDVMADRMIYDKRWEGRNLLEHFEASVAGNPLTDGERRYFQAMKTGYFSLFKILDVHHGSYVALSDRLVEIRTGRPAQAVELIDFGLSETGVPDVLLATRLLDAGGFFMTSGVSYPFNPDDEPAIMKYLREREPGFGKKRLDMPEDYSLYFYRLHGQFGIEVSYESEDEE